MRRRRKKGRKIVEDCSEGRIVVEVIIMMKEIVMRKSRNCDCGDDEEDCDGDEEEEL